MKKLLSVLLIVAMLGTLAIGLSSCGGTVLEYELSELGDYYIVTGAKMVGKTLNIPAEYKGLPVREIGFKAFYDDKYSNIETLVIPDSVKEIGYFAFGGCASLTSITLPETLDYIASDAFSFTGYYEDEDNWEDGLLYLDNYLLAASEDYTGECVVKEGTRCIVGGSFFECEGLTSITVPNGVVSIGDMTFTNCTGLTEIALPDSVKRIGADIFSGCTSLKTATLGNSLTEIPSGCFFGCTALTSVYAPKTVKKIGMAAFFNAKGTVYFNGTTDEWSAVVKGEKWNGATTANQASVSVICTK